MNTPSTPSSLSDLSPVGSSSALKTDEGLKREIGVWGLSANLVNIVVGAGIFVLPAIVAEGLGASGVLAYLFCGLLVALVMFCFAEVGSKVTVSGGPYAYIEVAFGKYAGFLTTWLFLYSCVTADAAVVNALADVLAAIVPAFKLAWVRICFFLVVFSGLSYINIIGVKEGIGLVKFNTIAKLTPLLLLIAVGWAYIDVANLQWETTPSIASLGQISLVLFFAFQGAESGLTVSGEVRNAHKTVPRSILIAVSGILLLYVAVQLTAQGVLGPALATSQDAPLAQVARHVFGPLGFTLMIAGAAISMFGYLSGEILSIPRAVYRAGLDRVIPWSALSKLHPKHATPYVAIIIYATLNFILASVGGFKQLAILSSAAILLVYLGVVLATIKLRSRKDLRTDGFRIPGGYLIPVLAIGTVVWLLSNLSSKELIGLAVFVGVLSLIYYALEMIKKDRQKSDSENVRM